MAHTRVAIEPLGETPCDIVCLREYTAMTGGRGRSYVPTSLADRSLHGYAQVAFTGNTYQIPLRKIGRTTDLRAIVDGSYSPDPGFPAGADFSLRLRPANIDDTFNSFTGTLYFAPYHGRLFDGSRASTTAVPVHTQNGQSEIDIDHLPLAAFKI
jgi:hypothetical protein